MLFTVAVVTLIKGKGVALAVISGPSETAVADEAPARGVGGLLRRGHGVISKVSTSSLNFRLINIGLTS